MTLRSTQDIILETLDYGVSNYGMTWPTYNHRYYEEQNHVDSQFEGFERLGGDTIIINQNIYYLLDENRFYQVFETENNNDGWWPYQVFSADDLQLLASKAATTDINIIYYASLIGLLEDEEFQNQLGQFTVSNPDLFFTEYKKLMLEHAKIAEEVGSDLIIIGQELGIMFNDPDRLSFGYSDYWTDIIASIRQEYSGKITYGAHFGVSSSDPNGNSNEGLSLSFGDQLDAIGINLYSVEPLDEYGNRIYTTVSVEDMVRQWARFPNSEVSPVQELRKVYDLWKLPLVITETGRMSGVYLDNSWEYRNDIIDFEGQANKYFADLFVLNVYLGDIDISYPSISYHNEFTLNERDFKFSAIVNDKPAESVIQYFYSGDFKKDDLEVLILPEFSFATGFSGNDTFLVEGFTSIDIHGGAGTDSIVFQNFIDDYSFTFLEKRGEIQDALGNVIRFGDIELVQFFDFQISLTGSYVEGSPQNDLLVGTDLDDWIVGRGGGDQIDGGSGFDSALFLGDQDDYKVTLFQSSIILTDRKAGSPNDVLYNIENIIFQNSDTTQVFSLSNFTKANNLSTDSYEGFIELYIAYFNRAPDAVGLNFWATAFANGLSLDEIAGQFAPQPETVATYPEGTSSADFATAVYNNVLGRVPDQAGLDFWVGVLNAGAVSRDQFILEILRGVEAGTSDRAYLDNKVDVGAYFAVHKGMSDVAKATAAMAMYDGTENSIDQAVTAIDDYYQAALHPENGEFLLQVVGVLDDPFT